MPTPTYTTIDEYIAAQPEAVRPTLERVRGIIRRVLPDAEEAISYQIAAFKVDGQYVVYLSASKRHFALHPVTDVIREALGADGEPYYYGKGTMRFMYDEKVPARLIERVVRILRQEAAARAAEKAAAKKR